MAMLKPFLALLWLSMVSTAWASPNAEIMTQVEAAKPAVLAFTETLVNMPSGSDDYPALAAKYAVLEKTLRGMGAQVNYVDAPAPREGTRNMLASWKGKGTGKIMYIGHIDTVWTKEQTAKNPFRLEGDKAYGAGVGDMQISVAMLIHLADIVVNKLQWQDKFDTLTIMLNCDEEVSSFGSGDLISTMAAKHDVVLSFDTAPLMGVVSSARGNSYFRLDVQGVESHSGLAPDKGKNAGYELAHQLLQMRDLSNKEKGTDVNWTRGAFGTKGNIIPGSAWAQANVRISQTDELARIQKDVMQRIQHKLIPETTLSVSFSKGRPPFTKNPASDALARHFIGLAKNELGLTIQAFASGAGVDSCYAYSHAPTLEALGVETENAHSDKEYALVSTLVPRMYMALRLTEDALTGKMDLPKPASEKR